MLEHLVHSEPEGGVGPSLPQEAGWADLLGRGDDLTELARSLAKGVIGVRPFRNDVKIFLHRTEHYCTPFYLLSPTGVRTPGNSFPCGKQPQEVCI